MNNNFEHLEMPLVYTGRPKFNGFQPLNEETRRNIDNRQEHGTYIKRQSQELSRFWNAQKSQREQENLPTIDGGIPIMLEIDPDTDIEFLRGLGFEIVSEVDNGFVLVSSEDTNLTHFNEKLQLFIDNAKRSGSPAKVYGLKTNDERIDVIMSDSLKAKWDNLIDNQNYLVELSVSCNGRVVLPDKPVKKNLETNERYNQRLTNWENKCQERYIQWDEFVLERQDDLERIVNHYNGNINASYMDNIEEYVRFPDSFTTKLEINGKGLKDLVANYPYIFEVVLLEDIVVGNFVSNCVPIDLTDITVIPPNAASPIIGIIDSGVEKNHLLAPAIVEEYSYVPDDDSPDDKVPNGGHGTRVAGIALTNNSYIPGNINLPFKIRNIKVLDETNTLKKELVGADLIASIVKKYNIDKNDKTRIFNHSIGEQTGCELVHMSSWAAAIDKYSYEKDVLFIQSAGNIKDNDILDNIENGINYPDYLNYEFARICNPAQSLQALTVGSVSHLEYNVGNIIGLGKLNEPSSFSRSGPGIWDSVKPDVVEYGGTHALKSENGSIELKQLEDLCVKMPIRVTRNKIFAQDKIGTSFSTPKVTAIAGELESILPNASTLLYRGLIVQSAKWPEWAYSADNKCDVLRRIGYGIPSLERATRNDDYRVTLFSDNMQISANDAHIYKVPIPHNLRDIGDDYDIEVQVTLSYNANPRRTRRRIKGYLSTWLEWSCSRLGEDYDTFKNRIFLTGRRDELDEGDLNWMIGSQRNYGQAENFSKKLNTVQKDWAIIQSSNLPEDFCVAVRAHQGWSDKFPANYSLVVTFEAVNRDLELYNEIRQAIEVEIENNRVQVEINN